jgi:hypothetical protein
MLLRHCRPRHERGPGLLVSATPRPERGRSGQPPEAPPPVVAQGATSPVPWPLAARLPAPAEDAVRAAFGTETLPEFAPVGELSARPEPPAAPSPQASQRPQTPDAEAEESRSS